MNVRAAQDVSDCLPDVIAEGLCVLFCGINPGMTAAAAGHHFAGRGNRFWRVMYLAGFTPQELAPEEDRRILHYGCGLTSLVERPTATADQLSREDFLGAADAFEGKVERYAPTFVAFLGKAAYSALTGRQRISWGRQSTAIGASAVWLLPNPSGRNRAYGLDRLVSEYRELHEEAFGAGLRSTCG